LLPGADRRIEPPMNRPVVVALPLLAMLLGLAACPSKEPLAPVGKTVMTPDSASPSTKGDNVFRCKTDPDCRSSSYYCGGCQCLALADQETPPQCIAGDEVKCLIDPCRGKTSFCNAGHCDLREAATPP
jgi:hypothetical protein